MCSTPRVSPTGGSASAKRILRGLAASTVSCSPSLSDRSGGGPGGGAGGLRPAGTIPGGKPGSLEVITVFWRKLGSSQCREIMYSTDKSYFILDA